MRAVLQRVSAASVEVAGRIVGQIGPGLLILLGVGHNDTADDARFLADKTAGLRIFADADGKFNRSLLDTAGAALVVSQFTLFADARKGRRPSFTDAAPPAQAEHLVAAYCTALRALGVSVETGVFGAMMQVALVNEGPVTIILDSETLRAPSRP